MVKNIPNMLTILRFLLVPIISIFLFYENYIIAIAIIMFSCFTDILDGYIARKYDCVSDFGKLMDPVADKVTQIVLLAILTLQNIISPWLFIIVVIKDFIMILGGFFFYSKHLIVSSNLLGKAATVVLYMAIVMSMLIKQFEWTITVDDYLYYIAITIALLAFANYIRMYSKNYLEKNKEVVL